MDSDEGDSNIERNGQGDDDDDYDYNDGQRGRNQDNDNDGEEKAQVIQNHHYDEAVEVSDGGSEVQSDPDPEQEEEEEQIEKPSPPKKPAGKFEPIKASVDSDADEDKEERQAVGGYNAADYANLPVSQEVKDLFKYITRFRPTTVDLDTKLKAFIPDYIPAVGEVDAFLKPSKPDGQQENIGLLTIDEPCLNQSKESTMRLLINNLTKRKDDKVKARIVDSIEDAEKNPKQINKWISDVGSIQRQPPSVGYSKPFPNFDNLMEVWPAEVEDALQNLQLPTGELDLTVEEYAKLACVLVDIPVHNTNNGRNLIESLHVFFTLYAEFSANQHFQQQGEQFVYGGGQDGM